MKFLFINGSPHKGNTWKLSQIVKENLIKIDSSVEFEEIHLIKENIPFCIGCSNCFRLGYEKCPHYNKISPIIKYIEEADGVIFVSSTFNMKETALLKNLFDHLSFMLHRPYFFKSKSMIITTAGGVGAKSAAKSISATLKGIGFNRCYLFSVASFSWNAYKPKEKTIHKLSKITKKFYKDVKSKKLHYPKTSLLIPYNLFRGISLSYTKGSEYETEDGNFWTNPIRKDTVYDKDVPLLFIQKIIGNLFYFIGKTAGKIKSTQVTYKKI